MASLITELKVIYLMHKMFDRIGERRFHDARQLVLRAYGLYGEQYPKEKLLPDINILFAYLSSETGHCKDAIDSVRVCCRQIDEPKERLDEDERKYLKLYLAGIVYYCQRASGEDLGMPIVRRKAPGQINTSRVRYRFRKLCPVNMDFWKANQP